MPGNFVGAHQGCQVPFRPPIPNVGLLLRQVVVYTAITFYFLEIFFTRATITTSAIPTAIATTRSKTTVKTRVKSVIRISVKTLVFLSRETGMPGNFVGAHQGCQVPFRPPIPNVGLLRRCSGKGLHLAMTGETRGFSRVAAGFSSYDGEFRMPLVLAQGSPIFHSSCEGKLGIALE